MNSTAELVTFNSVFFALLVLACDADELGVDSLGVYDLGDVVDVRHGGPLILLDITISSATFQNQNNSMQFMAAQ